MPAPEVSLKDAVLNYLHNRADFYEAMLSRLPDAGLKSRIQSGVEPITAGPLLLDAVGNLPGEHSDELIDALMLLDLLKKRGFGTALGQTTVSVDEAFEHALQIEQTGLVLLSELQTVIGSANSILLRERESRKQALANLIRLNDELRYHRLRLGSSA